MVTTSTPAQLPSGPRETARQVVAALLLAVAATVAALVLMLSAGGTTTVDRAPLPVPAPHVSCPGGPPNAEC